MPAVGETQVSEARVQQVPTEVKSRQRSRTQRRPKASLDRINVGAHERGVSVAAGAILATFGLFRRSLPGLIIAGVGGALVHRGLTGKSYVYNAFEIDTSKAGAIHVEQTMLIDIPQEELYQYWRNFKNLPRFMTHLESVEVLDDRRSHWVASTKSITGGKLEWEAEITADEHNQRIAWRTLPGSNIDHTGEVRFKRALGDRGTEVHAYIDYNPPAGSLGHWIAKLSGNSPDGVLRDDLRNFKRLMECGEIPTIIGQPQGTCTGSAITE